MTDIDIDAIRRLCNRATGGNWTIRSRKTLDRRVFAIISEGEGEMTYADIAEVPLEYGDDLNDWRNDAEFIAAARTLLPACADEIEKLRAEREHMELHPTGTVEWLKKRVAELTRERDSARDMANAARAQAADLLRALDHARPIVEAAQAWRAQFSKPADTKLPRQGALIAAVDALPKTEQQYLIWSHKQNAWWGPGAHGYRWDITRAGHFTLDRANDHASTRSWPADHRTPPEVVIPAPPLHILGDPERIDGWITEQIKTATEAKIAARNAEKVEVAR